MLPTKQDSTSGEPSFARLWEFDDLLTMPSIESLPTYVPTLVPWNTSLTWQLRLKFFLTGVLFPMICLTVIGAGYGSGSLEAPWQSGRLVHYIAVLTGRPTIFVFWPLLFFSFFCLSRWCFNPLKHNSFWIQIGLVTGVIQSMVFSILLFFMSGPVSQIMALFIGPLLALIVFLIDLAIRKKLVTRRFSIKYLIGIDNVGIGEPGFDNGSGRYTSCYCPRSPRLSFRWIAIDHWLGDNTWFYYVLQSMLCLVLHRKTEW